MADKINDVKQGNFIRYKDDVMYNVISISHNMKGRGGATFELLVRPVSIEGNKGSFKMRLNSGERVDILYTEDQKCTFLYSGSDVLVFLSLETYEQIEIPNKVVGEAAALLTENMEVNIVFCDSKPIAVKLPKQIVVEITYTEPAIKNQTATSSYKPATVVGTISTQVPPFISTGEKIIINSEDFSYISRA